MTTVLQKPGASVIIGSYSVLLTALHLLVVVSPFSNFCFYFFLNKSRKSKIPLLFTFPAGLLSKTQAGPGIDPESLEVF